MPAGMGNNNQIQYNYLYHDFTLSNNRRGVVPQEITPAQYQRLTMGNHAITTDLPDIRIPNVQDYMLPIQNMNNPYWQNEVVDRITDRLFLNRNQNESLWRRMITRKPWQNDVAWAADVLKDYLYQPENFPANSVNHQALQNIQQQLAPGNGNAQVRTTFDTNGENQGEGLRGALETQNFDIMYQNTYLIRWHDVGGE